MASKDDLEEILKEEQETQQKMRDAVTKRENASKRQGRLAEHLQGLLDLMQDALQKARTKMGDALADATTSANQTLTKTSERVEEYAKNVPARISPSAWVAVKVGQDAAEETQVAWKTAQTKLNDALTELTDIVMGELIDDYTVDETLDLVVRAAKADAKAIMAERDVLPSTVAEDASNKGLKELRW